MKYEKQSSTGITSIKIVGRLSFDDHSEFHALITGIAGVPGDKIVFDLSALEFIDSAGLGMFIVARDLAAKRAMALELRGAGGTVRKLMDLIRFDAVVPMAG